MSVFASPSTLTRSVGALRWLTDHRVLAALTLAGLAVLALAENDRHALPFAVLVWATLTLALLAVSRRPAFAIVTGWSLAAVLTAISAVKMKLMGLSLHAFDAVFYLRDSAVSQFLVGAYLAPILVCAALLALCAVVCWRVYALTAPRVPRRLSLPAAAATLALAIAAYPDDARDPQKYYFGFHFFSSAFASLRDIGGLLRPTDLARRIAAVAEPGAYPIAPPCPAGPRPDLVVTLMESAFPPALLPELRVPAALHASFEQPGMGIKALQVPTYGGATWVSSAALFTSLPTFEFGWMRPYLPYHLQDRVGHALPSYLAGCGYRTAVISPLAYRFANEGPFLRSIGFQDYRDWQAIGARTKHERDRVYLDAAYRWIAAARRSDTRPLLVFVMTMATHSPFDDVFSPETAIPGSPFGNGAEMDEYLRRLALQRLDYDAFVARLDATEHRRPTVLLDFGDHHPMQTRPLIEARHPDALRDQTSLAFRTYYRILTLDMPAPTHLPDVPSLDIVYLAPTLLEAAGLPLDPVYAELARLRDACRGTFTTCPDHVGTDRHLKKLANAGLIRLDGL